MSLVGQDIEQNTRVRVTEVGTFGRANTNDPIELRPENQLMVTRVYRDTLMVRTIEAVRVPTAWGGTERKEASFQIDRGLLELWDPSAPRPRRLGKKPEGDEYIDISHPGIQWLFEDMGRYASDQGWCPQYDTLCARLGIPGRPRPFDVNAYVNGIEVTARIEARSQKEANDRLQAALAGKGPLPDPGSDPEPTPPDPDFSIAA